MFFILFFGTIENVYPQNYEEQVLAPVYFSEPVTICREEPWILVFEDDFDGTELDNSKWHIEKGVPRDHRFEKQKAWHQEDNIVVENGLLKIVTKREQKNGMTYYNHFIQNDSIADFEYTTGEIVCKKQFGSGKFEARIKIPKGRGLWPAFWLFSSNPWSEIDIFEFWNETKPFYCSSLLSHVAHMSVHYDHDNDGSANEDKHKYSGMDYSSDFHIYSIVFNEAYIKWYIDDVLIFSHYQYFKQRSGSTYPPVECHLNENYLYFIDLIYPKQPMNIRLNVAVQRGKKDGCKYSNEPDETTILPSQMEVDWVRFYTTASCADNYFSDITLTGDETDVYQVFSGNDVEFSNVFFDEGATVLVHAANSITLNNETTLSEGSNIRLHVDNSVCDNYTLKKSEKELMLDETILGDNDNELLEIYPNPTTGVINIQKSTDYKEDDEYELTITSMLGEMLIRKTITLPYTDKLPLGEGVYYLFLCNDKTKLKTHKIISIQ